MPLPSDPASELVSEGLRHWAGRLKSALIGRPRDVTDRSIFQHISLVAFLAWVGLGADGLSSSCYGPPEAFANLGEHRYLAVFLAGAIMATVFIISACYSHIIEEFPTGGGGYLVASKLLGARAGVVSGCALLVDYSLTITVSIAAAGDALFGMLGPAFAPWKVPFEATLIIALIVLNLRGIKESVQALLPIFLVFLATHVVLIGGGLLLHLADFGRIATQVTREVSTTVADPHIGMLGMLAMLLHAYSLGAGTYTGLEAVSNSMPVMREPRIETAKRTMRYMAFSLAFTAGGLIVAYLLFDVQNDPRRTMNHWLALAFVDRLGLGGAWLGETFVVVTLASEALLLVVGAQAGFIDGPRVLANMAHDSWMPRWFANLSERLATHNGVLLMGSSALAALLYTHGDVGVLVVMYSINVFVTFSLSMVGMGLHWFRQEKTNPLRMRRLSLFALGGTLCVAILVVTTIEKFDEGGWRTLAATGACVGAAFLIRRHYQDVGKRLKRLDETLGKLEPTGEPSTNPLEREAPTAVILVGAYSGLGIHTLLNALRFLPDHFRNLVFVGVGVVDSGNFKGSGAVDELITYTRGELEKYVDLGRRLGLPSTSVMALGTDAIGELERLCIEVARRYPKSVFFAGQLLFRRDTWLQRLLHNQTAYALQRRLHWAGVPMIILPIRVR